VSEPKLPDKRWSIDLEKRIQEEHFSNDKLYNKRYGFDTSSTEDVFVIDTPPPYPSGTWHIGAVAQYSMIDVIARSQRLVGKKVYFPWGVDRNGINIEFTVEKNHGRKMKSYERSEFLNLCKDTIEEFTVAMRNTAKRVGLSCDYEKEYQTDSPEYRVVTQSIFIDLFRRGDIIEDLRPNIFDPIEGTTIADAEVERQPRMTKLVDVEWDVDDGSKLVISTTRPELICACGVVVVHPDDTRYSHLIGRQIELPVETKGRSKTVEIRAHHSVKMEFGTGVLMVCSFGDQNDVTVFRELGLTPFQAISVEGVLTDVSGPLTGLSVTEARNTVIEILTSKGKIVAIEDREQEVPVSERGKNPVEIILLKEWYVRQTHMQSRMKELIEEINFFPERNKQFLLDWMENITIDWPISRRRWYHTEIPIWYSSDETKVVLPPHGTYVQPWKNDPPPESIVLDRESREELGLYSELFESINPLIPEEKVFDTWMDSSNSNLFVSGYLSNPSLFEHSFPTSLRPQGKEIVRTWLYYTLLKSALLLDKPGFDNVWIDGLGMDPWGRKMSKSLGNGIDADSVLECGSGGRTGLWKIKGLDGKTIELRASKIGSECFRLWKACDAQVGDDFHINPEEIEKKYFGVLTKLFNVARFASFFEVPEDLESEPENLACEDKWILSEFSNVLHTVQNAWNTLDIYTATQSIKNFGTGILPSHWLEMAKSRLYAGDTNAAWTIHRIVRDLMAIFSPVCPFFTHYITDSIYGKSAVDIREYPKIPIPSLAHLSDENLKYCTLTDAIVEFNSSVWKKKKESGISLNSEIEGFEIPNALSEFSQILSDMHKLS